MASYPIIPKFKVPFKVENGQAQVIEQDTADEVAQCVEAVIRTEVGTRDDRPQFGIADVAFTQGDSAASVIRQAVNRWEPRASTDVVEEIVGTEGNVDVQVNRKGE